LDLFCAWQDVYLMSLLFFLSGLFVWPSLARKGSWTFLRDRFLRLGLPLVLAVYVLMPIALYPAYLETAADPSLAAYWTHFMELPFWPCGPQWFLWQLLGFNIAAALVHLLAPTWGERFGRWTATLVARPLRFFGCFVLASAVAYVPLALAFSPWAWTQYGPFAMQLCRPLHYVVYFVAGLGLGAQGLERGLLAADGMLARRWGRSFAAAVAGFVLWIGPTALTVNAGAASPLGLNMLAAVGFVVACATSSLFALSLSLRLGVHRGRAFDSLSKNAYGMYLIHYVFIVWLQYALLGLALFAIVKGLIVFAGTLALSWAITAALGSNALGARLIGAERRVFAKAP
jgi:peptidoglycan/LPS O-acetylase OafA/YrhL